MTIEPSPAGMLLASLTLALAAAGLGMMVRALAPSRWRAQKPLSCDLCTAFWSTTAVGLLAGLVGWWPFAAWWQPSYTLALLAATGVSSILLRVFVRLDPGPAGDELLVEVVGESKTHCGKCGRPFPASFPGFCPECGDVLRPTPPGPRAA